MTTRCSRRTMLGMLAAGLGTSALAVACGAPAPAPTATPAPAAPTKAAAPQPTEAPKPTISATAAPKKTEKATIVFWGHNPAMIVSMYKKLLEQFAVDVPEITVDYQQKPGGDYAQLLLTAVASGQAPDVFRVGDWQIAEYVATEVTGPLSAVYKDTTGNDLVAEYAKGILEKFTFGGRVYGIPEDITVLLNVANMDYLKEGGITAFPTTVEDFVKAGKAATKVDGGKWVRSGFEYKYNHELWETIQVTPILRSYGASVYAEDGQTLLLDSAQAVDALQFYYDSIHTQKYANPAFATATNNGFEGGDIAMVTAGPWQVPAIKSKNVVKNWQAGVWPTGPKVNTMMYAWGLGIYAKSKVMPAASQYLGYLATRRISEFRMETAGFVTGHKDTESFAYVKNTPEVGAWLKMQGEARWMDKFPSYPKTSKALSKMLQSMAFGKTAPKDALAAAVKELKA